MPASPSSAEARAGAGDCEGLDTPRTLIRVQNYAQKTTNYQKKPRCGSAQERVRMKHDGGGEEARNWRHDFTQYRQGPGRRSRPEGGGGGVKVKVKEARNIEGRTHKGWQGRHHVKGSERGTTG